MRYLLNLLCNHFLFGLTLFAAGGGMTSLGGDGGVASDSGAGDGGASSGTSGDGGEGGATDAGDDSGAAAAGADDGGLHADAGANEDPNAPVDLGDGRQVPGKWKKLFDAAKEQGLDKEVKQLFFSTQRLAAKFPGGVNEALKLAEAVEAHGGLDAIGQLKFDIETYQADAELFQNSPDKWIETSFAENAEQSLKAFTHALDFVSEHHAEQYDHLMAKVIVNDLDNSPVHEIYQTLAAMKDSPEAQQLAKKLADYYNHRKNIAAKVPEKKIEPERVKLNEERTKLQGEQEQLRNQTVNSQTIPRLGRQMTASLEKEAKAVGFDLKTLAPGVSKAMRGEILNRVMAKAASDGVFTKNYRAVLKQGDTQRAAAMMDKKHDTILADIVREVAQAYGIVKKAGGARPGVSQKPNQQPGGGGAMLRVTAKPPAGDIDWSKTGNKIYDSVAVLKNGKTVTWA